MRLMPADLPSCEYPDVRCAGAHAAPSWIGGNIQFSIDSYVRQW
jgi:hypothetical protein